MRDNMILRQEFIRHEINERVSIAGLMQSKNTKELTRLAEIAFADQGLSYIAFLNIDNSVLFYRNFGSSDSSHIDVAVKDGYFNLRLYEILFFHDSKSSLLLEMPILNSEAQCVGFVRFGLPLRGFYIQIYYFWMCCLAVFFFMFLSAGMLSSWMNRKTATGIDEIILWIRNHSFGNRRYNSLVVDGNALTEAREIALFINGLIEVCHADKVTIEKAMRHKTEEMEKEVVLLKTSLTEKARFLASIGHDIKTPMSNISSLSKLMMESCGDDRLLKYVQPIHFSSAYLLKLANQILDFSKNWIEMPHEFSEFSIGELISEVVGLYRHEAEQKKLSITVDNRVRHDAMVFGDMTKLRQVLINLVSNAVKFTEKGSVSITVGFDELYSPNDGNLNIVCADSGRGIDKHYLPHVFEPFSQEMKSLEGSGLGLSIAKRLVESLSGAIKVESRKNKGSTFEFFIPARLTDRCIARNPDCCDLSKEVDRETDFGDIDIMVVEDNEINQFVISEMMKRYGCRLHFFKDGLKAESAYQEDQSFALVMMDCGLPIRNGFETARQFRHYERLNGLKAVPIVAYSADATHENRVRCKSAGMDGFMEKPLTAGKLSGILRQYCNIDRSDLERYEIPASLCRMFLKEADGIFFDIECAAKHGDFKSLRERVHYFSASLLAIEEKEASMLCNTIEMHAGEEGFAMLDAIESLRTALTAISAKLESLAEQAS